MCQFAGYASRDSKSGYRPTRRSNQCARTQRRRPFVVGSRFNRSGSLGWWEHQSRRDKPCRRTVGTVLPVCHATATSRERGASRGDRAAYLFRRMHSELLTGPYKRQCYQLERSLEGGPYNCVTSTILYICICRASVYERLPWQRRTTCTVESSALPRSMFKRPAQNGFRRHCQPLPNAMPGSRKRMSGRSVMRSYWPKSITIEPWFYWRTRAFPRPFGNCQRPVDWTQGCAAQQNLVAAWNNWSLQLCDSACFKEASEKVLKGLQLAPENPTLLANDIYVHQQWALTLWPNINIPRRCRFWATVITAARKWNYSVAGAGSFMVNGPAGWLTRAALACKSDGTPVAGDRN